METGADKIRAFAYAIAVHLACVALMFVGLLWTHETKPVSVAGSVIEATLVSAVPPSTPRSSRPTPPAPRETAPRVQPKPEPKPEQAETPQPTPQAPIPKPDTVDQDAVARLAAQQAEEKREKEQEERRKQRQIELDEQEQREAEQRERLSEMQREQEQQLADLRRKREEAERKQQIEQEKLRQLEDQREPAPRPSEQPAREAPPAEQLGNNGSDNGLSARYALAIQQAVQQNWLRPDSAQPGIRCTLRIVQIPGGEVIQVSVTSPCNADDLTRRSIEAAVLKAQPLPYNGYESVFQREIRFNFRYDGQ
jgi:colicin import membrane protein